MQAQAAVFRGQILGRARVGGQRRAGRVGLEHDRESRLLASPRLRPRQRTDVLIALLSDELSQNRLGLPAEARLATVLKDPGILRWSCFANDAPVTGVLPALIAPGNRFGEMRNAQRAEHHAPSARLARALEIQKFQGISGFRVVRLGTIRTIG